MGSDVPHSSNNHPFRHTPGKTIWCSNDGFSKKMQQKYRMIIDLIMLSLWVWCLPCVTLCWAVAFQSLSLTPYPFVFVESCMRNHLIASIFYKAFPFFPVLFWWLAIVSVSAKFVINIFCQIWYGETMRCCKVKAVYRAL